MGLINKKERNSLFKRLSAISTNLCKTRVRVKGVDKEMKDEIGYTSDDKVIHLSTDHPLINALERKEEQIKFVKGVWVHEQAHQLFTNFLAAKALRCENIVETKVRHMIFNIVEDGRIENLVCGYIGGIYTEDVFDKSGKLIQMSDLTYSKRVIYKNTPPIDEPDADGNVANPFSQVIRAMIQYGDAGIIKGKFTDEEAEKLFAKLLPIYDNIIEMTSSRAAIKASLEITEILRPLWEAEKEKVEKMMKELESLGKGEGDPSTSPFDDGKGGSSSSGSASARNREKTRKKISAAEVNKMAENGEIGESKGGSGGETVEIEDPENLSEEALKALSGKSSEDGEEGTGSASDETSSEEGESAGSDTSSTKESDEEGDESAASSEKSDENGETSSAESSETGEKSDKTGEKSDKSGETPADEDGKTASDTQKYEEVGHINDKEGHRPKPGDTYCYSPEDEGYDDYDDYVVPESEIEKIADDIGRFVREDESEERRNSDFSEPENIEIPCYKGKASALNLNVSLEHVDPDDYEKTVHELRPSIQNLTSQFARLFKSRAAQKVHKTSGKVNINRAYSGKVSCRIFDKRSEPSSPDDIAIFLLVDESGSMRSGQRYQYAKLAAIGIAEMCEKTGIPIYIMGFSADESRNGKNYSAVHYHYIKWKNNKLTRQKLLYINGRSNNFDGFSVRYAGKVLSKRKEQNKFLITISDGAPACYYYHGFEDGIADTRQAVKEINRFSNTLGVAIGGDDSEEAIRAIYGDNCLCVPNVETLFRQLGSKIKKLIKEVD